MKQPHESYMVRPFDAAWSIIKQYDVNSYRGKRTLGREGRMALRDDAMQGANQFHQARIDAMRNLPEVEMGGRFSQSDDEPFNPFTEGGAEELRAALRAKNPQPQPQPQEPISTGSPTAMPMGVSEGKPREMRRGNRPPSTPRPGFRSREEMPLTDSRFQ